MKNYAAIFLTTILILTASAGFTAAQDATDSYFANQVKLSKPQDAQPKENVSQNGAQPSNDDFANAEIIALGADGELILTRSNSGATKEANEPNHAENVGGRSVWFKFTPTVTSNFEIRTVGDETNFDTTLAVYGGTGNGFQTLYKAGYNDDCYRAECGTKSRVRLVLDAQITYYIAVDGYNSGAGTASGTFNLLLDEENSSFEYDNLGNAYNLGFINAASIAGTNYMATAQAGEPNHSGGGNENGGKSVWYRFQVTTTRAMTVQMIDDFKSEVAVYESLVANPTFAQLNRLDDNNSGLTGSTPYSKSANFFATASRYYFVVLDSHTIAGTNETGNFQLKIYQSKLAYSMQLTDAVPMASMTVFRPADAIWYNLPFSNPFNQTYVKFGLTGDTPVPADFDGDAISNIAVTRNRFGLKYWYIKRQDNNDLLTAFQWGLTTDKEIVGDFDRDGLADAGVIRKVNGSLVWYVRQSSNSAARTFVFGLEGDRPVIGDFDGDGATEVAVVRAAANGLVWYILKSEANQIYTQTIVTQFGIGSDLPAVEDFDGDGKSDIAVFRPSNGTWYILRSGNGQLQETQFGANGDKPQPADYDADGKSDLAVYRQATGEWYFWYSKNNTQKVIQWGKAGDIAISSMARFALPEEIE